MPTVLACIAVGAGLIGIAYANLAPQTAPRWSKWRALSSPELRLPWLLALIGTVALAIVALVIARSRSVGPELSWGLLIGGAVAVYAFFESCGSFEYQDWGARTAGLLSAACLGPAVALIFFRENPHEVLGGCALAAIVWAVTCSVILRPAFVAAPEELRIGRSCYRGVEIFALATLGAVAGARLGVDHFPSPEPGAKEEAYWVFPVLLLAAEALTMVLATGGRDSDFPRWTADHWPYR